MPTASFTLLYPEQRVVSSDQIRTWYADAVANGEIDIHENGLRDTWEQAKALHHAGLITLKL